jgi:predicted DNA-binding antitoxin AbrB/MazE fold protein
LLKGVASMEQMLEAMFENGTFRLLEPSAVTLVDGQHVRLTVETEGTLPPAFTVPLGITSDNSYRGN